MLKQMAEMTAETRPKFPRMLLGTAMIFWGWMVDLPMVGLALAFLLEGPHWVGIRWKFSDTAHVRAWSLSVILMLITAFFLWMGGIQPETVRKFISWMPLFLVTLQFTQSYGFDHQIPLHTFSYFSRKKLAVDRAMGLNPQPLMISFTPVYFVLCLLFSGAGVNAHRIFFFPGILLLSAWCLWKAGPAKGHRRSRALFAALLMMAAIASVGQWGMRYAHELLMGGNEGNYGGRTQQTWNRSNTQIGQVGQIKQSPEIYWRLQSEQGNMPRLLHTASYNRYFASGHWRYETPDDVTQENDFQGMNVPGRADKGEQASEDEKLFYTTGEMGIDQNQRADLPRFSMRGMVKPDTLLPLPGALHTIYLLAQDLEHNSVGTIRITPRHAVLEAVVRWDGDIDRDGEPFSATNGNPEDSIDLDVPAQERAVLREIITSLGLSSMPLEQKIRTLQNYFRENFTYSTWLTIEGDLRKKRSAEESNSLYRTMTGRDSALAQFLLEEKKGHCEYFATATTLLLRLCGEKARYTVGFSVQEKNLKTGEMILRGTHAHAWCRVWNESSKRWIDVDTTPPSWVTMDAASGTWMQNMLDSLQRLREDFTIWRTQPENQTLTLTVFSLIAAGVFSWIGYKLWTTRSRVSRQNEKGYVATIIKTPLSDLERWLAKKLGQRPVGMPFGRWIEPLKEQTDPALIDDAIRAHNQLRYDPQAAADGLRESLTALCKKLRSELH